jgi:hypothetical protein
MTSKDIQHGFGKRAHDIVELFKDTNKIATFMRKLENQGKLDPDRYDRDKYVGDGFEFLVEIIIKTSQYDNRINISGYEPVQSDDNGVDGVGFNSRREKCAVQVKYRSNTMATLTANEDHLSNFIADAMFKFKIVAPEDNTKIPRHYVFTTAKGLNFYTDNDVFKGFVKCYGIDDLKSLFDNNYHFWDLCRNIALELKK